VRKAEGGSSGSPDGLCMIDPVVLRGVINDLATMEAAITAETTGLKAEFDRIGVPATAVNDLTKVATWLHDELPMLRRRHAAAVLLESQRMEFCPGTKMLSMPEDPAAAAKQAGELVAQRVRDGLDGKPPGRDGVADAVRAVQRIRSGKERLSPDDLVFLETFYRGLGKVVYRVPGYLADDVNWVAPTQLTSYTPGELVPLVIDAKTRADLAAAIVGGLLTLSDERRGGGWNRLPKFVQDAAADPWRYPMATTAMGGAKAQELAAFLAHGNDVDRAGVVLSKRLAITVAESAEALRTVTPQINDEVGKTFLELSGRNEQAMHDLLTHKGMDNPAGVAGDIYAGYNGPKDFLTPLTTYAWSDDGKAASSMFDWIADAKRSNDPSRQSLAVEAMNGLVTTLTDPSVMNRTMDTEWSGREALGVVNPEIARCLARDASAFLTELGGDYKKLETNARLFTLIATDPTATDALAGAIYLHHINGIQDAIAHGNDVLNGAPAGRLQGLLGAAVQNVALERGEDLTQAKAEADALRGKILGTVSDFVTKGLKVEIPSVPGVDPVDMADKFLGRLITMENGPVEPQQINTGGIDTTDPTGARTLARYNFAKALIDAGKLKVEDLNPEIRTADNPPRLKMPSEFETYRYDNVGQYYDQGIDMVPEAAKVTGKYLDEFSVQSVNVALQFAAQDEEQVKSKLGVN
jgi:hypothetical protein